MDDRRRHRRFPIAMPCNLRPENQSSGAIPATVVDISFGGLQVVANECVPVETAVALAWTDPPFAPGDEVFIKGRIVSAQRNPVQPGEFRIGVAFSELDSDQVQLLLLWAQMQSLVLARSLARSAQRSKARENSWR